MDERVRFLKGWFKDTLPSAPIDRLAVLRLDGDLYGSTIEALDALYPKLSAGGFVIVDDYGATPQCRQAIDDFRRDHAVEDPIEVVDWGGVYWQKSGSENV
jgi:O-methyltransferase